jgi:hypothetical protein
VMISGAPALKPADRPIADEIRLMVKRQFAAALH